MPALSLAAMAAASADGATVDGTVPVPEDGDVGALGTKAGPESWGEMVGREAAVRLADVPMAAPMPNDASTAMTMATTMAPRRRPADHAPLPAVICPVLPEVYGMEGPAAGSHEPPHAS